MCLFTRPFYNLFAFITKPSGLSKLKCDKPNGIGTTQLSDPLVNVCRIEKMILHAQEEGAHLATHLVVWRDLVAVFPLDISYVLEHQIASLFRADHQGTTAHTAR